MKAETGRSIDGERQCTGFERQVPMQRKLYPVTLYHVSVNKNAVCREGIKALVEIKPEKLVQGIGGFADVAVSFSYDKEFVDGYAKDLLMVSRIAQGIVNARNIEEYLDRHDYSRGMRIMPSKLFSKIMNGGVEGVSLDVEMELKPIGISTRAIELYYTRTRRTSKIKRMLEKQERSVFTNRYQQPYKGMLDDLKRGRIFEQKNIGYYIEKHQKEGDCVPFIKQQLDHAKTGDEYDNEIWVGENIRKSLVIGKDDDEICEKGKEEDMTISFLDQIYPDDYRETNDAEERSMLFSAIVKYYFTARQKNRGRQDPFFFGVHFRDYLRIHPDDIGMFKVLAYIPKPLEVYLDSPEYKGRKHIEDDYPSSIEEGETRKKWEPERDNLMIAKYEREVRIPPKYTTMLEEIPIGR